MPFFSVVGIFAVGWFATNLVVNSIAIVMHKRDIAKMLKKANDPKTSARERAAIAWGLQGIKVKHKDELED